MPVYVSGYIQGVKRANIDNLTDGFMCRHTKSKDGKGWDITYLSETPMYSGQMPFSGCCEGLGNG